MMKFKVHTEGMDALNDRVRKSATKAEHIVAVQVQKDTSPFVPALTDSLDQRTRVEGSLVIYLADVATIRGILTLPPGVPEVPADMEHLTFQEANDIERILVMLETLIEQMVAVFRRNAAYMFFSGNEPLPSAKSDLGRTWAGLDAMGTTWRNWQVASWYLLLYGDLEEEGAVI